MEWSDDGIVLGARLYGEGAVIVNLITRGHGRHAGLVRGGSGVRARGIYEPGNRVRAVWRARLAEHLGHYTCELVEACAARHFDDPLRLAVLSAATAVAEAVLPEREPHSRLYESLQRLLLGLDATDNESAAAYVRWEVELLAELGFGLDLGACTVTGATEDLVYVSPRSGRAVSRDAGAPYGERLLRLPAFLLGGGPADRSDIRAGLKLTGFFLDRYVFAPVRPAADHGGERAGHTPPARDRLVARIGRLNA
jgi:DNA repair protein RecO (recombination protein O)